MTSSQNIELPFGDTAFTMDASAWPNAQVLLPSPPPALAQHELEQALDRALDAPVDAPPLAECAARARSACVVVSDKTRSYGLRRWLPHLLDRLNSAGLPDHAVTVLIGNGTHGPHSPQEKQDLLDADVCGRVPVADHHADDPAAVRFLGETSEGTPVYINKILLDAELRIVTGAVRHHYYAGFTGGRKGVAPGSAARETIIANHSLVLRRYGGGGRPAQSWRGLQGNPVHADMLAAARMAGHMFLINAVTDAAGAPAALFAGDLEAAHLQAVQLARSSYEVSVPEPADLVIASCGGAPGDISFYQSHKSLDHAFHAVRPGGCIVLVAQCPRGLGPAGFDDWLAMAERDEILSRLRNSYDVPGQTALATLTKTAAAHVILVSDLPPDTARLTGAHPAASLEQALGMIPGHPRNVIIMPAAALTVPVSS